MGKLTTDEVKYIAKLANLKLTVKEVADLAERLSKVIGYVDALNEVDTNDTEPTAQTTGLSSVFREDVHVKGDALGAKSTVSQAKKTYGDYFVVPIVLEEKTI